MEELKLTKQEGDDTDVFSVFILFLGSLGMFHEVCSCRSTLADVCTASRRLAVHVSQERKASVAAVCL